MEKNSSEDIKTRDIKTSFLEKLLNKFKDKEEKFEFIKDLLEFNHSIKLSNKEEIKLVLDKYEDDLNKFKEKVLEGLDVLSNKIYKKAKKIDKEFGERIKKINEEILKKIKTEGIADYAFRSLNFIFNFYILQYLFIKKLIENLKAGKENLKLAKEALNIYKVERALKGENGLINLVKRENEKLFASLVKLKGYDYDFLKKEVVLKNKDEEYQKYFEKKYETFIKNVSKENEDIKNLLSNNLYILEFAINFPEEEILRKEYLEKKEKEQKRTREKKNEMNINR